MILLQRTTCSADYLYFFGFMSIVRDTFQEFRSYLVLPRFMIIYYYTYFIHKQLGSDLST